ncbi:OmpA family protein [Hyalangium sp.]|uniref:OmpA family protein n=1 Tax=Hyalangium sp. TaxID=2028555 RepID=UPI002D747240|nr:OmpA family protein [Hyalangium sp.]HYI03170.1 OmpA family protein [Hyalangium sp.]
MLVSSVAFAQERNIGFELERMDLNPGAAGSLVLGTGELMPAGDFRISAVGHYQHNPLVFSRAGKAVPIVGSRTTLLLAAAYAPFSWLEMGVQLPLVAFQQGADLRSEGIARPAPFGLATPLVSARVGLLSQLDGAWGDLALEMGVGAPVGSLPGFARDEGLRYAPRMMMGRRFGWFRVALDTRMVVRPAIAAYSDREFARGPVGNEAQLGLALAMVGQRLRWEVDLRGTIPLVDQPSSAELLLGPRYLVNPSLEVFALAGVGGGTAPGTPLFRVLIGAAFGRVIPPRLPDESAVNCAPELEHTVEECPELDEDEDEVPNGIDQCDDEAGTLERQGCPRKDSDGDGLEDKLDACPSLVGTASWQGCPMPDDDKDGIENERDACPSVPGVEKARGCPLKDRDKDEIEDDVDQCPDLAGPVERQGCPESDLDKDNIPNVFDTCANEPGPAENRGCPAHEVPLVELKRTRIELSDKVYFVPGQPRILERSFEVLNWVAKVMREHPDLPLVIVGGHTDNRGNAIDNLRLSQVRAEAVRQYLIQRGVPAERLQAKGYGQERPIASNSTSIGREINRRIEFTIVVPL